MNCLSLILIAISLFFDSCGGAAKNLPNQNKSQTLNTNKIYCEQSYTNFAWGYQHNGIYVDAEGSLYSYSYQRSDKPWSPKSDTPTEQELEDKYSHGKKLIKKFEPEELQAKLKLLVSASKGQMSKRTQSGADMGSNVCRCYVFDEAKQSYQQVELRVRGDWSYENLAPSAKALADWLESLRAANPEKK